MLMASKKEKKKCVCHIVESLFACLSHQNRIYLCGEVCLDSQQVTLRAVLPDWSQIIHIIKNKNVNASSWFSSNLGCLLWRLDVHRHARFQTILISLSVNTHALIKHQPGFCCKFTIVIKEKRRLHSLYSWLDLIFPGLLRELRLPDENGVKM